ncbi:DUF6602 domain-containing protein [Streptomyces asoensis]|uniref:DUF6602 domain-containing protein n=1 Tax=Streptomyces asoensis TaxID=249586 RepID=UPI0033C7C4DB
MKVHSRHPGCAVYSQQLVMQGSDISTSLRVVTGISVVEEYWSGVLRRLQAEVDIFNKLIKHWGERGRENELSLARLLENLVPQRYGVGSGMIIDSQDNYSQQTDIVIYNQADEPAFLAQSNQVLFPIENVRACIEVKTTVNKDEIKESGVKRRSLYALTPKQGQHPLFHFVGYTPGQHADTIATHLRNLQDTDKPDLFCVVDNGMIGGRSALLRPILGDAIEDNSDYVVAMTYLHERDVSDQRQVGQYHQPPSNFTEARVLYQGGSYPVVRVGKEWMVAEPSRALLLFCACLVHTLATHEGKNPPASSHYLSGATLDITTI